MQVCCFVTTDYIGGYECSSPSYFYYSLIPKGLNATTTALVVLNESLLQTTLKGIYLPGYFYIAIPKDLNVINTALALLNEVFVINNPKGVEHLKRN